MHNKMQLLEHSTIFIEGFFFLHSELFKGFNDNIVFHI